MHKMKEVLGSAEKKGRKGDTLLGHLTPGDTVIPAGKMSPQLRELLSQHFEIARYTAGHEKNKKNPHTDLPEFFSEDGGYGTGMEGIGGAANAPGGDMGGSGGFDQGDYSAGTTGLGNYGSVDNMPDSGAVTQGFDPSTGGIHGDGYSGGAVGGFGGWLDGIINSVQNTLGPPGANGFDQTGGIDIGGGTDDWPTAPPQQNPLMPQPNIGTFPGLPAPFAPDVPDSLPDIGRYYSLMRGGVNDLSQRALAENMMAPFLTGNKNVYGR